MNTDGTDFHTWKNATKTNPFELIPLQTTRKENNWKTEEALARAAVTLEKERIKGVQSLMFIIIIFIIQSIIALTLFCFYGFEMSKI